MPKLWSSTIETHRAAVRDAILDSATRLVARHGLLSVTMSRVAESAGIGRATLYKYFPDVEAILLAWHERQVNAHLAHLVEVRDRAGDGEERLAAVLEAYATLAHQSRRRHDADLAAFLHRADHSNHAHQQLRHVIRDLVAAGVASGHLRQDVAPEELASYCLHALAAAGDLPSKAAVRRLVTVTVAGLRASDRTQPVAPDTSGPRAHRPRGTSRRR